MSDTANQLDLPDTVSSEGAESADVYVFPASSAQQRLWFLDRLMPGTWAYNLPGAYRITGDLKIPLLEKTFSEIVRRHEILRTTFRAVDGEPMQIISDFEPVRIPMIDLRRLNETQRQAMVERQVHDEFRHVFDLARGPLMRLTLLRLGDHEYLFIKNMHHIITDLWSDDVFMREWLELYESFEQDRPAQLPSLPIQYADFSDWQRQELQGETVERQFAYWKKKLGGTLPTLQLQTDQPAPSTLDFTGDAATFSLPPPVLAGLKEIAKQQGVTLFIAFLAAFKILLQRYTRQQDVIVGSPIANRGRAEIENLIGLFLNTLVLRTDLSGNPSFLEVLGRVRETTLGAFENPDVPFEMLVEKLQPQRNFTQNPLCQVMFVLHRSSDAAVKAGGISIRPYDIRHYAAKFDLVLMLFEKEEAMDGMFVYSTALFDKSSMEQLASHFQTLLEGIIANPAQKISALPLLKKEEIRRQLTEWNPAGVDFPHESVSTIFEGQVARTPGATALVSENTKFTYDALNQKANRLAARLTMQGVRPGEMVAICMERSAGMIVAMLAILKAGAAYVPLDPGYPADRLAFIVDEISARIVISDQRSTSNLPPQVTQVFPDGDLAATYSDQNPPAVPGGNSPAYVIYTSGSTGTPKGVIVPHRGINRLVINTDYACINSSDVVAQASTCAFDAATFEVWGALLNGAALVIIERETLLSAKALESAIDRFKITTLFVTTALFNLVSSENPKVFRSLKHLLFGGEVVDPTAVRTILLKGAPKRLLHVYGPTEATTFATWHLVNKVPDEAATIPIGKPIANTRIYLLDPHGNLVPEGVGGEICIGGPGVALGYLNAPDLTASRFIASPFPQDEGSMLYRSGDVGRYLSDGNIVFMGRLDDQVKIRGFRIEPGEITLALKKSPSVQDAVTVVHERSSGEKRLVAYVVKTSGASPSQEELIAFLRSSLPDYMIPTAIVFMDSLPLNANGKIDRAVLPDPGHASAEAFVAPRTAIERDLVKIWEEVLGREKIGVRDDFFEMGGHSLMAVRLFSEIEKRLGKNLPLATVFEAPTVEHLAEVIGQESWDTPWSPLVPIQSQGKYDPFFCIHGGDGGVLFYSKLASLLAPDQPFYGLQAQGLDGGEIKHRSLPEIAALYLKEIRAVQPKGPYYLGGYSFGGVAAFEIARQLREKGEDVALVAMFDANNPAVPARRYSLGERIKLRMDVMRKMPIGDRLAFVWKRGVGKIAVIAAMQKEKILRLVSKARMKSGNVVPVNYRSLWIHEAHLEAFHNYKPGNYDGRLTVFRAENPNDGYEFDRHLGWDGIAAKGLEIIDVPGEHETMFQEPHVRVLADTMKACMEKARARYQS